MMPVARTRPWFESVAAVAMILWAPVHAEVSVTPGGSNTLIAGIIFDDPDPVGVWAEYSAGGIHVLNPGGHLRGDGRPDLASVVDDPDPVGVWAYNTGGDHDITFSEWDGSQWTATEFLTFGTEDELNPRVFVESDGTVHVVWWVAGTQQIRLVTRAAGSSTWSMPEQVTAGRRPSAAVFNGVTYVAYERDSGAPGMAQDIVVARQDGPSSWSFSTIASTPRTEQLDPILHAEQGKLWLDWMHDTAAFGCAVWTEPGWYAMPNELWADSGWVGVESARKTIRGQMMD